MFKRVFKALRAFIEQIRDRRVHMWAVFYFFGIWKGLEPLIALFGLSPAAVDTILNIGFALFPLVVVRAWFHGEPGRQDFSPPEGSSLIVGCLLSGVIYALLSQTPPPRYTVLMPLSRQESQWLDESILNAFERRHDVDLVVQTLADDYDAQLLAALQQPPDSSNLVLAYVPHRLTGVLLRDTKDGLVSFEHVLSNTPALDGQRLASLLDGLDSTAVAFGRKQFLYGEHYFLPAEYEVAVLVYRQSAVDEALRQWPARKQQVDIELYKTTGMHLPADYALESAPGEWDHLDLFVACWLFANPADAGNHAGRFAKACSENATFVNLLSLSLAQGAGVVPIFNLPNERNGAVDEAIVETFFWEAIFRQQDLYYPAMWLPNGLTGPEVVQVLKVGKAVIAFLPNTYLADLLNTSDDFRVSPLPAGASVSGQAGVRSGVSNLWFWAIPEASPAYDISYALAAWLVQESSQRQLANRLMKIPVRKSLLQMSAGNGHLAGSPWGEFLQQIRINKRGDWTINPYGKMRQSDLDLLRRFYFKKWQTIVARRRFLPVQERVERSTIQGLLMLP